MKRKAFLQTVALLTGGLFVDSLIPLKSFANRTRKNVRGSVTAKGKPLKGVVLSDGFSVVATDKQGRYELPFREEAQFVFVSVPSGHLFPQENKIACCYRKIGEGKGNIDFELVALEQEDNNHQFIIWADPQIQSADDVEQLFNSSVPDVQALRNSMEKNALVHGITVGDIVFDHPELYDAYEKAVAQTGISFFQALGNHDMDYDNGGDVESDNTFQRRYGPTYYSFNRGKVHYVVLDNVRYLGPGKKYDGYISEQQLDWLKKDLAFVPKTNLVILCLHIPVHNAVKNREALYKVLEGYKVHIMSGHTHNNRNVQHNGIYEHVHGTLCGAWWTGPICDDGAPRGYGVYEVKGTELSWYYKATGFDKNHQLNIDLSAEGAQKKMCVNVWNWDADWKVEWWADEQYKGALQNTTDFDPMAVRLYKGNELPKKHPWAEPVKTDHLFFAILPQEVQQVKVKVTDRFGNKYEQTKSVSEV